MVPRVNAIIPPLAIDGPDALDPATLRSNALGVADIVRFGSLTPPGADCFEGHMIGRSTGHFRGKPALGKDALTQRAVGFHTRHGANRHHRRRTRNYSYSTRTSCDSRRATAQYRRAKGEVTQRECAQ